MRLRKKPGLGLWYLGAAVAATGSGTAFTQDAREDRVREILVGGDLRDAPNSVVLDCDTEDGQSRNPEIYAGLLRALVNAFPDHPTTHEMIANPQRFESPVVQLMALAASQGIEGA